LSTWRIFGPLNLIPNVQWNLTPNIPRFHENWFQNWECIFKSCEFKSKCFFSSWAKHEFKMSHEPNEMQHIPIQGEKCVQVVWPPKQHFKVNHQCLQNWNWNSLWIVKIRMHDVIFGLLKKFQCVAYYQNKFNVKKLWWFEELQWEWKTLTYAHLNYDR